MFNKKYKYDIANYKFLMQQIKYWHDYRISINISKYQNKSHSNYLNNKKSMIC